LVALSTLTAGLLVALGGGPASAQAVTIDLCATSGGLALPDAVTAPVWGFALAARDPAGAPTCAGVIPLVPGPVLDVGQDDVVTVVVHNELAEEVVFEAPGQAIRQGSVAAAPHGVATYTFTASDPGTFLYQSAAGSGRQLAMGLYGALIVRPPVAGRAYASPTTGYDQEAVLVLSAVDPAFNANPATYDLGLYKATYWLINGKAYPQTDPIHAVAAGRRVLLRYVNAGFDNTTMRLLGARERVIARDARPLANPIDAVGETMPAGGTEDVIVSVPAGGSRFALYNRQLHLTNGTPASPTHTPGGMMTFIEVP
jgi:FtsP/CotA-like multicopper oxidase with cupredoxin domain